MLLAFNITPLYTTEDIPTLPEFIKEAHNFEIPPLSHKDLKKILVEMAPQYYQSFNEEVGKMTEIINSNKTIKTEEKSVEWRKILIKKWNLTSVYTQIEDKIVEVII
jgi:hypothetical protein